jgi:hypothetical protein
MPGNTWCVYCQAAVAKTRFAPGFDLRKDIHAHPLARDESVSRLRIHLEGPFDANAFQREALSQLPFHFSLRRPAGEVGRLPQVAAGNQDHFLYRVERLCGHTLRFSSDLPASLEAVNVEGSLHWGV